MLKLNSPVLFVALAMATIIAAAYSLATAGQRGPASPFPPGWSAIPKNCTNLSTARHVTLVVNPRRLSVGPGMSAVVQVAFVNHGHRGFTFRQQQPPGATFVISAVSVITGLPTPSTRTGRYREFSERGPTISPRVAPGRSVHFWKPINLARYVDLTMPGKYRVTVTAGKIASNPVLVTVKVPRVPFPPAAALRAVVARALKWSTLTKGVQLLAQPTRINQANPPKLILYLRVMGIKPLAVRLMGNPLWDFRKVEATGPNNPGTFTLVRHPKSGEHAVPYANPRFSPLKGKWFSVPYVNKSPAHLTVYGKWLAKQKPSKNLLWRKYILKPGLIYRYAEPIVLSARFDLSDSGTYRVRIRLGDTNVWSPWETVAVPSYYIASLNSGPVNQ